MKTLTQHEESLRQRLSILARADNQDARNLRHRLVLYGLNGMSQSEIQYAYELIGYEPG